MSDRSARRRIVSALAEADVRVDGGRPWDIGVHDERLFQRVVRCGLVGLGDAYVDGWWDCDAIDTLFDRTLRAGLSERLWRNGVVLRRVLREKVMNLQGRRGASRNGRAHYDLGNDLFESMLDATMTYSCGSWRQAATLEDAQEAKLDLVCRKLRLEPGVRVLDIGCGWGSFARHAAERYGASVVGVTVSREQAAYASERCRGLPVEIRLQDYREVDDRFDRIASIGMFEHVGPRNHRTFMRTVRRCLEPDGLCLLHFFATQRSWPNVRDSEVIWITRHIFPGLAVPSLKQVGAAVDGMFVTEDLHNFGPDYDPTLRAWYDNFQRNWPRLAERYGERFRRMWCYYLLSCAGAFRSRKYQVWQIALSPTGVRGGCGWLREAGVGEGAARGVAVR